jgi:L-lactate dehydrogenase complex protein LldG
VEETEGEEVMKGDREKVLARIREALVLSAPHHDEPVGVKATSSAPFRAWLPPVGEAIGEQVALFARQSEVLKTEFLECADVAAAAAHLAKLAAENGWKRIAWHAGALNEGVVSHLSSVPGLELLKVGAGYDPDALEACDAGLTECETLVAQTGSVMVSALSSGGRALSVLPHHHVVVARREQMVSDLAESYARVEKRYPGGLPSFLSFISGPSRTGDIERILVLGAHGPKKLTVLLLP